MEVADQNECAGTRKKSSACRQPADGCWIGRLVSSVQGRDSGRYYLVVGIESDTILRVADGAVRKVENPKKKNVRHLKFYDSLAAEVVEKIKTGKKITNLDVRKAIESLVDKSNE